MLLAQCLALTILIYTPDIDFSFDIICVDNYWCCIELSRGVIRGGHYVFTPAYQLTLINTVFCPEQ